MDKHRAMEKMYTLFHHKPWTNPGDGEKRWEEFRQAYDELIRETGGPKDAFHFFIEKRRAGFFAPEEDCEINPVVVVPYMMKQADLPLSVFDAMTPELYEDFEKIPEAYREVIITYFVEYSGKVMEKVGSTYSRAGYRSAVKRLNTIASYGKEGKVAAGIGVYLIREYFGNRPALMRELELADFVESKREEGQVKSMEDLLRRRWEEMLDDYLFSGELTPLVPVSLLDRGDTGRFLYPRPGLLYTRGNRIFLPVFSSEDKVDEEFLEDMGYQLIPMPLGEVIRRRVLDPTVDYPIVLNPFTDPQIFDDQVIFDVYHNEIRKNDPREALEDDRSITLFPYRRYGETREGREGKVINFPGPNRKD